MRAVIWTIVAILVVAAVIFLVVARGGRQPKRVWDAEELQKFGERQEKRFERLVERIDKIRASVPMEQKAKLDELDAKINELRNALTEFRQSPSEAGVAKIQDLMKDSRKLYRELGGSIGEVEEEEEGK